MQKKHKNRNIEKNKRFKKNNPNYWKDYYKQNPEIRKDCNSRWRKNNPERMKFYRTYSKAIREGTLIKPSQCQICGKEDKIHGHHFDYSKPLKVIWVCQPCHSDIHRNHKIV